MAIDVKSIQVWSERVIDMSVASVKVHQTILIGMSSFLFLLYLFSQSLFVFFVFAIPIFTFIGYAFRLIFRIHQENLRLAKGENYNHVDVSRKVTPSIGSRNLDKRGASYVHAQSVRRRNSKIYRNHVHFKEDLNEKEIIFSTTDNHASVDKAALAEETPKEIREVEDVTKTDRSKLAFGDGSGLRPARYSSEGLVVEGENSDEGEDEDEEEAPGNGNEAVEWTEDDQKNLMDLGFSEMERNKRLESLIAKRKARKLLSLQVRRSLMNIGRGEPSGEMGSFLLPNIGAFPRTKLDEALMSPTPGSAPSVLVPLPNPFDIPYDPQEEKPNLTGGFQEELAEPHHNDAKFCRYQSFSCGTTYQTPWELDQNQAGTSHGPILPIRSQAREIPEFSKLKKQLGKENFNEQNETKTSQESETKPLTNSSGDPTQQYKVPEKALDLNEVHSRDGTNKVEDVTMSDTFDIQETGSSSSSEIIAPFSTANKDEILKSLSFSMRKNIPLPELDVNARREELFYNESPSPFNYPGYGRHTPSYSLASDMHVEVSEASSQITNLSSDGGSPKYDVGGDLDVENEGITENLEDWVAPPLLKRVEENESRLGEVREVSEQDIIKVGFSKINQDIEETDSLKSNQSCSSDSSNKVQKEVQIPKEPFNSVESTTKDAKTINDMNDKVELVSDDQGIIEFIQHTYGENTESMNQGTSQDTSAPTLTKDSKPVDVNTGNHIQPDNNSSKLERQSEPAKAANELNFTGKNIHVRDTVGKHGPSKASSRRSSRSAKVKSFKRPEMPPSPCSTPNSSKFYLMANLSFDDVYVEPQQSNVESEGNSNVSKNSQAGNNHTGDSVRLQESTISLSSSTGENNASVNDIGPQTSMKENVKTETLEGVEEIGKLEKLKDMESHSKLPTTIENSEPTGVVKNDSGNVGEVKRKSEPENIGQASDLVRNNSLRIRELIARNSFKTSSSPTSPGPGLMEPNSPFANSTSEDKTRTNLKDRSINEGSGDGHVQSTVPGDIGSQTSTKENEKTEIIKGTEEIGKLEKSKDFESHSKLNDTIVNSKPTGVVKSDSGNVAEVKSKSEPEHVGKGLDSSGDGNTNIKEAVPENGLSKRSSSTSPEPVKEAEEIGKLEKSKDIESHSKLHNNVANSEPIGLAKSDSGNVGDMKSKSEPEHVGKGSNSIGDSNINVKEEVPENGLSKASSSTSPEVINGAEEIGKLEKPKDIESHSKSHNTIVNSEPTRVMKSNSGNVEDAKSKSEPENVGKGIKLIGDSNINFKEAVPENGLSKPSSYTPPEAAMKEPSVPLGRATGEDKTSHSINDRVINESSGLGLVQTSIVPGDGSETPMKENEINKTTKGVEDDGKLDGSKDVEGQSKIHNTIDSSKPVEVPKSDSGNAEELSSNIHDRKVLAENGTGNASVSTSPGPVTKESSFPLRSSSVEEKVSTSVNDTAINEGPGPEVVQKNINQDDKGSQITMKENERTETIEGVKKMKN